MAVVINAKGTSISQFQIGKQGPIIKNNSGIIEFKDNTDTDIQVQILSTANAVNNLALTGSATGNDVTLAVIGTDTNINIKLEPKGTGEVILGSAAATSTLQAENDQDLFVLGGNSSGAAVAGDLILRGGDGSGAFASGNVEIRGGTGGGGAGTVIIDSTEFALPVGGGITVGSATGGNQGSGTINATALYINGNALPTVLTGSNTLDFASIASLTEADLTITVTGAVVGNEVALGLPASPTSGIIFNAFVSAANTVTVRAHNYTAGAIDPASATYSVRVFQ